MGDEDLDYTPHKKKTMINHQELILSVKEAIKPGVCTYCKRYEKYMIVEYFLQLNFKMNL